MNWVSFNFVLNHSAISNGNNVYDFSLNTSITIINVTLYNIKITYNWLTIIIQTFPHKPNICCICIFFLALNRLKKDTQLLTINTRKNTYGAIIKNGYLHRLQLFFCWWRSRLSKRRGRGCLVYLQSYDVITIIAVKNTHG